MNPKIINIEFAQGGNNLRTEGPTIGVKKNVELHLESEAISIESKDRVFIGNKHFQDGVLVKSISSKLIPLPHVQLIVNTNLDASCKIIEQYKSYDSLLMLAGGVPINTAKLITIGNTEFSRGVNGKLILGEANISVGEPICLD